MRLAGAVAVIKIIAQRLHMAEQVAPDVGLDARMPRCGTVGDDVIEARRRAADRPQPDPVIRETGPSRRSAATNISSRRAETIRKARSTAATTTAQSISSRNSPVRRK